MITELYSFSVSENLFINKKIRRYSAPDFNSMMNELKELHSMSEEKIAYVLDVTTSAVSDWIAGSRPFYSHGDIFIDLWKTLTDKSDEQIPRIDRIH
ncbi:hypothetical protein [Acinetobacter haemolyticus]|uniref:hypothetical protein n=1 Tax=Acinetobacter haemolyticus TaxID=29430 RepID=UPI00300B62E1